MMDCTPQEDWRYWDCTAPAGYVYQWSADAGYLLEDWRTPWAATFVCYGELTNPPWTYVHVTLRHEADPDFVAGYVDAVTCRPPPPPEPWDWGWYFWDAACFWDHWWCDYVNDRYWE